MIDHEYAKELINKEYDESYMVDFFNRYKDELSNVESSKRAIYIVILLLGDNLETQSLLANSMIYFITIYAVMIVNDVNIQKVY